MNLSVSTESPAAVAADVLVLPLLEGPEAGPGIAEAGAALATDLVALARAHGLTGKAGDALLVPALGGLKAKAVLLVGMGPGGEAGPAQVRKTAQRVGGRLRRYATVATTLAQVGGDPEESARALAEGLAAGTYTFRAYKVRPIDSASAEPVTLKRVVALSDAAGQKAAKAGLKAGQVTGDAVNWARDLVNTPSKDATPEYLAAEAKKMAAEAGLTCKVWTRAELERGGFGGVLGVGAGSRNEPRFVELTHKGAGQATPYAITGKGVTFDSGGLSLKQPDWMTTMKDDMSGAAATFAVMRAIAQLKLKINVIAAVPLAENMPDGGAIRPGDVLRHRGGKTSEVLNTDAEGRLILADALAFLSEKKPRSILDSATLTGAAMVALGTDLWAAMGNDRELLAEMLACGTEVGEPGWELPLWADYRKNIEWTVADVKNTGDRYGGAIIAGLFLKEFVGEGIPWVHMDVAGTAFRDTATDLWPRGATGSPVRTVLRYLERRAAAKA